MILYRNMLSQCNNKHNKVSLCLTDTSLYIYICVTHFGIANTKMYCIVHVSLPFTGPYIRVSIRLYNEQVKLRPSPHKYVRSILILDLISMSMPLPWILRSVVKQHTTQYRTSSIVRGTITGKFLWTTNGRKRKQNIGEKGHFTDQGEYTTINVKYISTMGYSNRDMGSLTSVLVDIVAPTMTISLGDRITEFITRIFAVGQGPAGL